MALPIILSRVARVTEGHVRKLPHPRVEGELGLSIHTGSPLLLVELHVSWRNIYADSFTLRARVRSGLSMRMGMALPSIFKLSCTCYGRTHTQTLLPSG